MCIRDSIRALTNNLLNNKVSKNFVIMKLKVAKSFINLLNRLIKIIETGQLASRILCDVNEKNGMNHDWMKLDIQDIISREIPCGDKNIDVLSTILKSDVVNLLNSGKEELERAKQSERPVIDNAIMNQFANYISELPGKFQDVNPRLFILLTSNLLTTCLREISLTGGQGFGAWWIVRCWVDEYLAWCFEIGGFLQDDFKKPEDSPQDQDTSKENAGNEEGKNSSADNSTALASGSGDNSDANFSGMNNPESFDLSNIDLGSSAINPNSSLGAVDLLDGTYGTCLLYTSRCV